MKESFKVTGLHTSMSGSYAEHIKNGSTHIVKNWGYEIGDDVEITKQQGLGAPDEIKVNGKVIWGIKERDEWIANEEKGHTEFMETTLKSKGIKHPIYNP